MMKTETTNTAVRAVFGGVFIGFAEPTGSALTSTVRARPVSAGPTILAA